MTNALDLIEVEITATPEGDRRGAVALATVTVAGLVRIEGFQVYRYDGDLIVGLPSALDLGDCLRFVDRPALLAAVNEAAYDSPIANPDGINAHATPSPLAEVRRR